jgi:restriction endonuclease S subunit
MPGFNEKSIVEDYVTKKFQDEEYCIISAEDLKKKTFANSSSPAEQRRIAKILSAVDKELELERKRKENLERIKKGLMNDLLTGKKMVEVS